MRITIRNLQEMKERGEKIAMLTAYDHPTARMVDEGGVPIILVGDSVGNNVLGYRNTVPVTMDHMVHHLRAVLRGARKAPRTQSGQGKTPLLDVRANKFGVRARSWNKPPEFRRREVEKGPSGRPERRVSGVRWSESVGERSA